MPDPIVRISNALCLFKLEATEGLDANPVANLDAFPFEIDSLEIGSRFTMEESNESTGSEVAGMPVIMAQPVSFVARMRLKGVGAGTAYTASIKPPQHALFQACGLKAQFQAAIAAVISSAGSATSSTLNAGFAATAQLYRGQRLLISGGAGSGAQPLISDYAANRLATLTDSHTPALDATTLAGLAANWTYAATSPADAAARLTDQPSGTLYAYEDGILTRLFGVRGSPKITADASKPGFFEMRGTGMWGGRVNQAFPANAIVATHSGPTFRMNTALSNAFSVKRLALPVSNFSFDWARTIETMEDPNTVDGFGAASIMGRAPMLECDPYVHQNLAVRDHIAELQAELDGGTPAVGAVRVGTTSGNRWSLCLPQLRPVKVDRSVRKGARAETLGFRAFSTGNDAAGRQGDAILCFD